ncbi:MAG: TraR/DksA family transcriptional regulator [Actinobacteria bacterium]|nr:TraR/DksA family transcriptional regulator [Actinomycetota bacterium]MBU1492911.1 TraR/DksA family transcriptional regulator [Actinomycetota bacterium]MBU1866677.1 TraR/DksA family transcriptional regulator [Actinomycetota bacterium]
MARALAKSTIKRLEKRLVDERDRLTEVIRDIEAEREEVRLSETSSERSPDPNTAEGGSLAFELEKELSVAQNAKDLLEKVVIAMERIEAGTYGSCADCGTVIPVARLDALPYAIRCVDCAASR